MVFGSAVHFHIIFLEGVTRMVFFNESQILGVMLLQATQTTTGSMVLSLAILFSFIFVAALMFRIPVEYTFVIVLPLLFVYSAYYSEFVAGIVVGALYLGLYVVRRVFR